MLASALILSAAFATGCSSGAGTTFTGNTSVVVLTTSTANDQLTSFGVTLNSLTLVSQTGNTVNLLDKPVDPDFIHVNGTAEPLVAAVVPQGIYTSAKISVASAGFWCLTLAPNGEVAGSLFADNSVPNADVTVTLPKPITVAGATMGLSLNLLVSKSASWGNCDGSLSSSYTIAPTFSIAPVTISATPTNSGNDKLSGLEGVIASSDGNGFTVNSPSGGPIWQVLFNGSTAFQGITGSPQLAVGMPVDIDVAIQADGSLLATRVEVLDRDTTNLSFWAGGPLLKVSNNAPEVLDFGRLQTPGPIQSGGGLWLDFTSSTFAVSGQLGNVANLPFQASFSSANMVAGQNTAVTFHETAFGQNGPSPTTITLVPQILNGTIKAISAEGGFTTYTVQLAPYDLFPTFAVQSDQTTMLSNPDTVVVYADSNTQMLNTSPVAVGSVMRFYGLVFNNNGTLRMDCAELNDGVPE